MKKLMMVVLATALSMSVVMSSGLCQEPQKGGVLRMIATTGPRAIGYYPDMGPNESTATLPAIERIMRLTAERTFEPLLAESVELDQDKLTMTIRLRKGIQFTDGSNLNADVLAWNLRLLTDTKKLTYGDKIKSIDTADEHTVVLHLKEYNNLIMGSYGWAPILSKEAFDTKGKDWVRSNTVATGPFKLQDWKRDVHLKWQKNENYWLKGYPHLDGIEVRYVPDPVTAAAMMEAKEADVWLNPPVQYQMELDKKGIKRQAFWPGTPNLIYANTKNPEAPTANQKVREAIEYALDKPTIAKALGYGYYTPMYQVAPAGEWGHDVAYQGRMYDPRKARELLAAAGYPDGLTLKLLTMAEAGGRSSLAEAIKRYLDDAGFKIEIDVADPGRFFSSMWGKGWDDLAVYITGIDETFLATIQYWYGPQPRTELTSLKMPPEFLDLCTQALTYRSIDDQKAAAQKLIRMIADQALIIPIYFVPVAYNVQPWVHMDYYKNGFPWWTSHDDWVEKH